MNQEKEISIKFWRKKISISYLVVTVVFGTVTFFIATSGNYHKSNEAKTAIPAPQSLSPEVTRYRSNNFKFAHPLLLVDVGGESEALQSLKNDITSLINTKTSSGEVVSASVYVKRLNEGDWISINGTEGYNGGSLLKVPIMMTYLREGEKNRALLERNFFVSPTDKVPPQSFNDGNIIPGKSYAIKDLLYYMIAKSDNYATLALNEHVNAEEYQNLFGDIGIPKPNITDRSYSLTCNDYSRFFRVLYNASYLSTEDADYALGLLTQTTFKKGLLKELPADIKVAHKFGEWGEPVPGSLHQLHESGIVYSGSDPYLITVMTKGKEVKNLPNVISEISKLVFDRLSANKLKS